MDFSKITNWICNTFDAINATEFNQGCAVGAGVVLAVLLLLMIIRIVFKIIFRRRRCRELTVKSNGGEVVISIKALEDTVNAEFTEFPSVRLNQLRVYRIRKKYMFNLVCDYDGSDGSLVQITDKIRTALNKMFTEFYGVNNIRFINLKFERLTQNKKTETREVVQEITPAPAKTGKEQKSEENDDIF